jgi:hypothetical protein
VVVGWIRFGWWMLLLVFAGLVVAAYAEWRAVRRRL